ncbi:TIGR03885 family FMN-dependent LLM class oxidoreductase [Gemmata sp. JC673]|uniref:TIGR03885 family FMN-dependent LLM class oxidoreductase n=1 Tax=Gemmata algarum TaxID=2975278 RepID=A0ABU5ERW2_9BACT|nr:TIGR03885 family FMN-dependent LLM class oxidoreductase [Gemmata algarum]MDY3558078.1 TIGR03885 family FMN-dependent LLM class oxidoreductase [Gemmata algarum]
MATIGYHCSHEQFAPSELLRYVRRAEQAGFRAAMCSDHFHPWSERQGQSGFAWSWLGAALQATALPFGTVNAPGQRYHPAVIAQAAATLAEMFPGRFWLALGTGQLLSEHVTGGKWPRKGTRQERLKECVTVMRALWAGETVTHDGLVTVTDAKLYTRPAQPPQVVGAAVSAETAEWVGSWADALITVFKPAEELKQVVEAFRRGGGAGKPMYLQAQTSYARTEDEAQQAAFDQWRQSGLDGDVLTELATPADFDRQAAGLKPEDLDTKVRISADLKRHAAWVAEYFSLGFEAVYIHQVGRDQERFIDAFGEHVLPALARRS